MALEKIEINGGVPIKYWRVSSVISFDADKKQAVIGVKGYFDKATRNAGGEHFKVHEFLIANTERTVQETRAATLDEKKELLPPALIAGMTDAAIKKISYDILVSETIVPVPSFDDFVKLYEKGKWQDGAYAYLKSGASHINGFFADATDA
jgi:hypothetical protein